jgi:large subunit ribosomal protein L9
MKVLLTETLDRIGIVGEVIDVSEGFARNYLLPKKLALQPTDGNIKRLEEKKIAFEKQQRDVREQKEKMVAALAGHEVTVSRAANDEGHLFGSVSRRDIAEELQKAGFNVTPEDVRLDEPLRRVDTFTVPVHLAGDLKADIKVWVTREKAEGQAESPKAEAAPEETPA